MLVIIIVFSFPFTKVQKKGKYPGCCPESIMCDGYLYRYEHLAKSAPTILDDSLSADSYLNVLYMPSTFPRSEKSRPFQESANNNSTYSSEFEDGPRSNLDNSRYVECVNYLQEVRFKFMLTCVILCFKFHISILTMLFSPMLVGL